MKSKTSSLLIWVETLVLSNCADKSLSGPRTLKIKKEGNFSDTIAELLETK